MTQYSTEQRTRKYVKWYGFIKRLLKDTKKQFIKQIANLYDEKIVKLKPVEEILI